VELRHAFAAAVITCYAQLIDVRVHETHLALAQEKLEHYDEWFHSWQFAQEFLQTHSGVSATQFRPPIHKHSGLTFAMLAVATPLSVSKQMSTGNWVACATENISQR